MPRAIAVSVAAAEQVTARTALWMTTQFVATAAHGAAIDVQVEVLAPGKRTNQVRVTGTVADGSVVFAPGVLMQTVTVQVNGDNQTEPNETFTVTITDANPMGSAVLGNATGDGTILNDDAPAITVNDVNTGKSRGAAYGTV